MKIDTDQARSILSQIDETSNDIASYILLEILANWVEDQLEKKPS